ncbi:hypothetical protein CLNEO_27000 [Anaerotignum neopropionicum]|uniref:Uncharacterized protein n=1 Tax=Anaerotignum neopropionicum TaxID=36847 RepID=A0A136WBU9_9FIRM|nr:hypothetical protein [Anaerotignum neopropionicum]KXL52001.1 hypothetical protein CLNEO_27000 [Anaerotignum neopropionicum]
MEQDKIKSYYDGPVATSAKTIEELEMDIAEEKKKSEQMKEWEDD